MKFKLLAEPQRALCLIDTNHKKMYNTIAGIVSAREKGGQTWA